MAHALELSKLRGGRGAGRRVPLLPLAAATAGWTAVIGFSRIWKRRRVARLQQGAKIARTPLGPIEYATSGEGEPLVVFHATPGGHDQGLVAMARRSGGSVLSARSRWSVMSWASMLSVLSAASVLSIGSFGSLLSIGSFGSVLSIGSSMSVLCIGSARSVLSIGSWRARRRIGWAPGAAEPPEAQARHASAASLTSGESPR